MVPGPVACLAIASGFEKHPVINISWLAAQEYIKWLNAKTGRKYRLPTEAEWEFAALGGSKSKQYKYAGGSNIDEAAWYSTRTGSVAHPVGSIKPNDLGFFDMSGNVWECCDDWFDDYSATAQPNRAALLKARTVCIAAAPGTAARGVAATPTATTSRRGSGTSLGFRLASSPQ